MSPILQAGSLFVLAILAGQAYPRGPENTSDQDEQIIQQAHLAADVSSLLDYLRKHSPSEVDPTRLDQVIRQMGGKRFEEREGATKKLISVGPGALTLLRAAQKDSDQEIARRAKLCIQRIAQEWNPSLALAVVRVVARQGLPETVEALLGYLPQAVHDPELEEEVWLALDALTVRQGGLNPACMKALKDSFAARRAAAGYLAGRRGTPEQRAAVHGLLADPDPVVRLRVAQGLLGARVKEGIPILVTLLDEPSIELAWQAEELLHWAAGEEAPEAIIGTGAPEARQRCRRAWDAWWHRRGSKLDLHKVELDYRRPGLIWGSEVERGNRKEEWHLSLYGCSGKPRWQLKTLSEVIDLHLLPGPRILMAGGFAEPVTECDLNGKILWQHHVEHIPAACERLPNGNTFIATTRSEVVEVTPEGREVDSRNFSEMSPFPTMQFVQRLRNGHLLYQWQEVHGREFLIELDPAGGFRGVKGTGEPFGPTGQAWKKMRLPVNLMYPYTVQALPGDHYLITGLTTGSNNGPVLEVDGSGKTVWQWPWPTRYAVRLANGNLLVPAYLARVIEIDRAGKILTEVFTTTDGLFSFRPCLSLVRLGFDTPPSAHFDLAASIPYRLYGLKSKEPLVRRVSAYELGKLGRKATRAVPALIEALDDRDKMVRSAAEGALQELGPIAIPNLVIAAKDKRPHVRASVAWLFGQFPGEAKAVSSSLIEGTKDENAVVRRKATWALGRIGPAAEAAVPALIVALKDKDAVTDKSDVSVPHAAAFSLGNIGTRAKAAVPALIEVLKYGDKELQRIAARSLGQIGSGEQAAVSALAEALRDRNVDVVVRQAAAEALGKIGSRAKGCLSALETAANDPDASVRSEAARALRRIHP